MAALAVLSTIGCGGGTIQQTIPAASGNQSLARFSLAWVPSSAQKAYEGPPTITVRNGAVTRIWKGARAVDLRRIVEAVPTPADSATPAPNEPYFYGCLDQTCINICTAYEASAIFGPGPYACIAAYV
jgi:hypothetical protein